MPHGACQSKGKGGFGRLCVCFRTGTDPRRTDASTHIIAPKGSKYQSVLSSIQSVCMQLPRHGDSIISHQRARRRAAPAGCGSGCPRGRGPSGRSRSAQAAALDETNLKNVGRFQSVLSYDRGTGTMRTEDRLSETRREISVSGDHGIIDVT
eukprot:COSAG01_NODE_1217_length_11190_cov_69.180417_3_plen_152_part_00